MTEELGLPLTKVRDPFGEYEGFAQHNNARLRGFLDSFGFDYEFASATEYYAAGRFDEMLLVALERFDGIMEIVLPTLGAEGPHGRPFCRSVRKRGMFCRSRPWRGTRRKARSSTRNRMASGSRRR